MSYQVAPWVAQKKLKLILVDYEPPPIPLSIVYPHAKLLSARVRVFAEWATESLRAELIDIRTNGYGFDHEEHEPGIICVAVPILTEAKRLLGAVSVTSVTQRTNLAGLAMLVPLLRDTAQQIAKDAQSWRFPDRNKVIAG